MSKRNQTKRPTQASRILRFFRTQANLTIRAASRASGIGVGVINHLEHGRIQVSQRHLDKLLPAYGVSQQTFDLFVAGNVALPQNLRFEFIEILKTLTSEQLRHVHPLLVALINQK